MVMLLRIICLVVRNDGSLVIAILVDPHNRWLDSFRRPLQPDQIGLMSFLLNPLLVGGQMQPFIVRNADVTPVLLGLSERRLAFPVSDRSIYNTLRTPISSIFPEK